MLCKSRFDFYKYKAEPLELHLDNQNLFYDAVKSNFNTNDISNIWVISEIHDLINKAMNNYSSKKDFITTMSYFYDSCEWILLWYADDYYNLDTVFDKKAFISYIENVLYEQSFEMYVKAINR